MFSSLLVKSRNAATAVRSERQLAFLPLVMRFQVISGNEQGEVEKMENVVKLEDEEIKNVWTSLKLSKKIAVSCLHSLPLLP